VAGRWAEFLGDDFPVVTRDYAIAAGWFGPEVRDDVVPLIGDVIVCSLGTRAFCARWASPNRWGRAPTARSPTATGLYRYLA